MPGGTITAARTHATLCDQIESCAPPVSDGYLDRAVWRSKLPISVCSGLAMDEGCIAITDIPAGGGYCLVTPDAALATRAYFALAATLSQSASRQSPAHAGTPGSVDSPSTAGRPDSPASTILPDAQDAETATGATTTLVEPVASSFGTPS